VHADWNEDILLAKERKDDGNQEMGGVPGLGPCVTIRWSADDRIGAQFTRLMIETG